MEHQTLTSRVNDAIAQSPVTWETMMRRRSSMSAASAAASFRRCSLLSVSMFDMPVYSGGKSSDHLMGEDHHHTESLDPFAPLSFGDQQAARQHQQQQLNHATTQFLANHASSNPNLILSDRSESSRHSVPSSLMSTTSNSSHHTHPAGVVKHQLPQLLSLPTTFDNVGSSSFPAKVSPLSCTKPAVHIPSNIMSNPSLPASNRSPKQGAPEDVDDDESSNNQNRFKPFHEEKWTVRYKELLAFHNEHNHAAVPHTYPPNPQLARWVKRQRRQYKLRKDNRPSTMTLERLEMLNSVGFIWDSHDVNWREKLHSLQNFRKEVGHCNVPSNYIDKKLATWVKCQRRQYKLYWDGKPSAMSPERIMELEKVGFEWEIRSTVPRKVAALQRQQQQQLQLQQQEFTRAASLLYQQQQGMQQQGMQGI